MAVRCLAFAVAFLGCSAAVADTLVASRTIRPQTILSEQDLAFKAINVAGGVSDPAALIGMETRVALYAGRPVRLSDVGPPAIVERNQIVPLLYSKEGLRISAEGRALDRAGVGEFVRVMNLASRSTVTGRVTEDGHVIVSK